MFTGVFWSLVLSVCTVGANYNNTCEEWVLDQTQTIDECALSFVVFSPDIKHMDKENRYAMSCEQTELVK